MYWQDEGYLLSKSNFDENSIIIEAFTLNHGKCKGIVYGGTSRKIKNFLQSGNKIYLNYKSKSQEKIGYFSTEIIEPISPLYFDNKKKITCLLSALSILKIVLPEMQINQKIYFSFKSFIDSLKDSNWIVSYIFWEQFLIKMLGFEVDLSDTKKLKRHNIIYNALSNNSFEFFSIVLDPDINFLPIRSSLR